MCMARPGEVVPWRGSGVSSIRAVPRTRWTPAAVDSEGGPQTEKQKETETIHTRFDKVYVGHVTFDMM